MRYLWLFYHSANQWLAKDMSYYAAAFSYYAPLALIPLILLSLVVSGFFYGSEFVMNIFLGWGTALGPDLLALINVAVQNLDIETKTYRIPLLAVLFFSSVSIFSFNVLGTAFKHIWNTHQFGFIPWSQQTIRSIVFVLILQIYLIFLIGVEGFLTFFGVRSIILLPEIIWLLSISSIFIFMFRYLAKATPSWRACIFGGFVSGLLVVSTSNIVTVYLGTQPVLSIFGAAGLILILLIWVYVLASIILYGATLAHLYDRMINTNM